MDRDMDTIRKIVLAVKAANGHITRVDGVTQEVFAYHAALLQEAGLAKCHIEEDSDSPSAIPSIAVIWRLTWAGHDFADSIKDENLWDKAKTNVLKPAASWTFGVLLEYLKQEILRRVGVD